MIELLRHFFGLCPDHASHMNLLDVLFGTGLLASGGVVFQRVRSVFRFRKRSGPPPCQEAPDASAPPHTHDSDIDQL